MKTIIPFHSISLLNKTKIEGVNKDGMVCVVLVGSALEAFLHDLQAWKDLAGHPLLNFSPVF